LTPGRPEWNGTKITFEIAKNGDKTEVRFTHVGLVPEHACFNACSNAWGSYINGSLPSLITTGNGQPNRKEQGMGKTICMGFLAQSQLPVSRQTGSCRVEARVEGYEVSRVPTGGALFAKG